jgi:hypothetical protein
MTVRATDLIPVQMVGLDAPGQHHYVEVQELLGGVRGAGPDDAAIVVEQQAGGVTKITLTDLAIEIVSVTTGAGVGGTKVYDFPAGFIKRLGCRAVLSCRVATADQADYTDGTPEGQLGIGTVAPEDADALGTDATDDDWGTAADFTMTAFEDTSVVIATEADGVHDGSATPLDLFVNALVDAGDIDDDTTTTLLVSGTIWLTWVNQGGA